MQPIFCVCAGDKSAAYLKTRPFKNDQKNASVETEAFLSTRFIGKPWKPSLRRLT